MMPVDQHMPTIDLNSSILPLSMAVQAKAVAHRRLVDWTIIDLPPKKTAQREALG
jgi:hypothetical protein